VSACLEAACAGARNGRDYTAEIESRRGFGYRIAVSDGMDASQP